MRRPEEIEEDHIHRLAVGLQGIGIDVNPMDNVKDYVSLRKILEACVSYANEAKKNPQLLTYLGLSDTTEKEI